MDLKQVLRYRRPAGRPITDFTRYVERKAFYDQGYEHWNKKSVFKMNDNPKETFRRDPMYTGFWNPVMWSDYPKQPAWTVPMPKMPAPLAFCIGAPKVYVPPGCVPPTEHMSCVSYPSWFPDVPPDVKDKCNPYLCRETIPFHDTWGCPARHDPCKKNQQRLL